MSGLGAVATRPSPTVLDVRALRVEFDTPRGVLRAVDGLDLTIAGGESVAVVGESGSGKSVFARTLVGLLAGNGRRTGTISIAGQDVDALGKLERRHFFGVDVAMVFQDPMTSLNPVKRIGPQLTEALRYHLGFTRADARSRAIDLLERVHVPSAGKRLRQYPHELSGGMRQRVAIAMALACEPKLLVADEPTTALDVTVQRRILDLLDEIRRERSMALLLITHDLAVARGRADRIAVMYAGRIREHAPTGPLFASPRHPYTGGLLASAPRLDAVPHSPLLPIPGLPPDPLAPPPGCAFAPRCRHVAPDCVEVDPPLVDEGSRRATACLHPLAAPRRP